MSVFTTDVQTICKQQWLVNQNYNSWEPFPTYPSIDDIIQNVGNDVLPFIHYNSTVPFTKQSVISAILHHYWTREIGMETVGLWKFSLCTRINEILPKYVEIAFAQDSMGNIWETETRKLTHSGEFETTGNENGRDTSNKTGTSGLTRDITDNGTITYGKTEDTTDGSSGTKSITDTTEATNKKEGTLTETDTHNRSLNKDDDMSYEKGIDEQETQTNNLDKAISGSVNGGDINKDMYSETPQNGLTDVENGKYLTNYRYKNNSNNSSTISSEQNTGTIGIKRGTGDEGSENRKITETESGGAGKNQTINDEDTISENKTASETYADTKEGKLIQGGKDTNSKTGNITDAGNTSENVTGTFTKDKTDTGTDSYTDTVSGYSGNKTDTLWNLNEKYLNIYQMIIGDVAGFFMGILG